jgi:hypothetical protein
MASTRNLQASVNWVLPHLRFQPFNISAQQPALDSANLILQTILGPPFIWPWNRFTITFTATANVQDYPVPAPTFGFLEGGACIDPSTNKPMEMSVKSRLEADSQSERPSYVAAQVDDNAGTITFRLMPAPDRGYPIVLTAQRKAPIMTSLACFWQPIPDELAYVYDHGLLSMGSLLTSDPRFQIYGQRFVAHLLGRQTGLSEMERNIFLANWLQVTNMLQTSQMKTQQGIAARQV